MDTNISHLMLGYINDLFKNATAKLMLPAMNLVLGTNMDFLKSAHYGSY